MFGTWKYQGQEYKTGKGILEIHDNLECPICLKEKRSISQPNCEHTVCIECFKRCYYGDDEPTFPYPDIEDEYYEDFHNPKQNPKWDTDYPLIKIYNEEFTKWIQKCENEEYLHKCPLCRK